MRRADALWLWDGAAYTDVTDVLGEASASVTLAPNQSLYIGYHDWQEGVLVWVDHDPGSLVDIVPEGFDGTTDDWKRLPLQEASAQESVGRTLRPVAFDFRTDGIARWGSPPLLWTPKRATAQNATAPGFPTPAVPPAEVELFWTRLRATATSAPLVLNRVLPLAFNTYAEHEDVSNFFGLPSFQETVAPRASFVRERIRAAEDWLDNYTRRSWRLRLAVNESHDFNPHGQRLDHRPAWFVINASLWDGSKFGALTEGRSRDFWLDTESSFLYFTFPAFRLRPYALQLNRYTRQQRAFQVTYVYGADFDTAPQRDNVKDAVLKRVASDLILQADWTAYTISAPDTVSKEAKAQAYREDAESIADVLRALVIA